MKKRSNVLFLLSSLLIACASATPSTLPTATISMASTIPTQTSSPTFTPLPTATLIQTRVPTPEASPTPLPGGDLVLGRVAQLGGSINGITVVGDVAYVGMGPRVAAIDISQHKKPQLIRQSEPLPGMVTQLLQISGGPAPLLLVNAGKFLVLVDTSKPDELKPSHQLELAGGISAMVWDDRVSILYAGGSIYQAPEKYTGFISAVGITTENHLKLINSVAMPEWPLSLALGEGSLFAGAQGNEGGLYHVKLKIPGELSAPNLVIASSPENPPLQPTSMRVIGEHLYLSYMKMKVYDITNPDQPVETWADNSGRMVVKDFSLAGEQIFVFGWTIFSVYVRGVITLPDPIVGSPMGEIASVTAMHNGDFLVAYNDLEIYDTANSQDLLLLGRYQAPVVNAIGAAVNEKAVFVVDKGIEDSPSNAVLRVLSLPDLTPLGQVTIEFPTSWGDACGPWISLDNDRLYLASANSVWVYDVSSFQPDLLAKVEIVGGRQLNAIAAFTLGENRLLVASQEVKDLVNNLAVYDLTDLQNPTRLGSPLTLDQGKFLQMTLKGSALYVMVIWTSEYKSDTLYVVDNKENVLTLRESLQLPEYTNFIAIDDDLVALTSTQGLSFVSAVKSEPLKLLSQTPLPGHGMGVAIIKDKVLVVVGDEYGAAQLLSFDIQDPSNPRQVGIIDIAVTENNVVPILVTLPYVVLVNGAGGVEVFDYGY